MAAPRPAASHTDETLRTSGELFRAFTYPAIGFVVLIAALDLFQLTKPTVRASRVLVVLVVIVVVAVLLGIVARYLHDATIRMDGKHLERSRFPFGHKRFALADIGTSVEVIAYKQAANARPPRPTLVLLDHSGRRLLRMRASMWSVDDMHRVRTATGAPVDLLKAINTKQLKKRHKHAVGQHERHPILWSIVWFVALLVVGLILLAVILAV